MSGFRSSVWDPVLIISQIICMQCVYYVGLGLWIVSIDIVMGTFRSTDQIFDSELLQFNKFEGKFIMMGYILNALTGSLGLWYIVQRTKQCLDFTCTVHLLHLVFCWLYNAGFPNTLSWWLTNIICTVVMTVLGEFLCMRTELQAIPLSLGNKADL